MNLNPNQQQQNIIQVRRTHHRLDQVKQQQLEQLLTQ